MPLRSTPIDLPPMILRGLTNFLLTLLRNAMDAVLLVLMECVNLETLTIDFGDTKNISDISSLGIETFPRLHTLTVRNASHLFAGRALRFLRAPALASLTIGVRDYPSKAYLPNLPHAFQGFIESIGSPTTIQSLTLRGEGDRITRVDSGELTPSSLPFPTSKTSPSVQFTSIRGKFSTRPAVQ
jgi:hypothetical protein